MIIILSFFIVLIISCGCKDSFHEELLLKPLEHGKVYSYFQFTVLWNKSFECSQFDHCHLFPHSLAEIIQNYDVQELHISLTEGHWRYRYWGYPVVEAPPGAELWVWFHESAGNINHKWKGLTSALSGLLCASFNFIDDVNSVSPKWSFRPYGINKNFTINDTTRLRYAALPREIVCTENLTPWKKLLPCDSVKGLSTLLNARYIHNTNYHSVGLHFRHICSNMQCNKSVIELKQTVSLVYDLVILGGNINEWSIRKLFGIGLFSHCPIAKTSNLYLDISNNNLQISAEPDNTINNVIGGQVLKYAVYNISKTTADKDSSIHNLYVKSAFIRNEEALDDLNQRRPPILYANRYIKEYGKENGGIITKIHNNHREPMTLIYFENIPWFVPIYYHTLKITSITSKKNIVPIKKYYVPGKIRIRPYHLEVVFEIPARSVVELSIDFDYMFLKWQEYPPDANHGFYVGSAVITAVLPYARDYLSVPRFVSLIQEGWNITNTEANIGLIAEFVIQLRTESLILGLPTPDFSMPYNVICLSCTVVALAFGPIHNITTKRLRLVKNLNKKKFKSLFGKKLEYLLSLFKKDTLCDEPLSSQTQVIISGKSPTECQ